MEIVYKLVGELIPYDNNPRINDGAAEYVAKSIKDFGFKVPIVLDSNNVIIAGHTRLKASLNLGLESVPCIICDDLSPDQVKALRLVDNKTAEYAKWDLVKLEQELLDVLGGAGEFPSVKESFPDLPEIDIDQYLKGAKVEDKVDEPELYQCPCCGRHFEVKE